MCLLCFGLCALRAHTALATTAHSPSSLPGHAAPPAIPLPPADHRATNGTAPPADIVVTGERYGEARVAAESEFSEEEIAGQGVSSIGALLERLKPLINGSGEEPVILINGRPAGFDQSVLSYPPEALARIGVLRPEAAAQYGQPPQRRVINLVLKRHFSSLTADVSVTMPTAGGRTSDAASLGRLMISGETRWNVQARVGYDSALRRSARNIAPRPGVYDGTGYVFVPGGGEIDPALSMLVHAPVLTAALPPGITAPPDLAIFSGGVNSTHGIDPNDFETLMPARRSVTLAGGVTRPIGDFSATLTLTANQATNRGERGLPMVALILPATNPWSPFTRDVTLLRPFERGYALRDEARSKGFGASLTLSGTIGGWQTNVAASYARNWSDNLLDRGVDTVSMQRLLDADDVAFNPYGVLDRGYMLSTTNRSRGETINTRVNVLKMIAMLPAGPIVANVTGAANWSRIWTVTSIKPALAQSAYTANRLVTGQISVAVPIARRGDAALGALGDLSLALNLGGQSTSTSGWQKSYGADLTWSPVSRIKLRGAIEYAETAPTFDQLDAPPLTTIARLFDYVRQETTDVVWLTGGNPKLSGGSRRSLSLDAQLLPFDNQTLALTVGYRESVAKGGIVGFPELTPAIEAAFPERVTRDGSGRLVQIDARAINIAHDTSAEVTTGVAVRLTGPVHSAATSGAHQMAHNPLQLSIAFNHRWRLQSALLTRPGIAVIDQIAQGGQSRHTLSFQLTAGQRGIGANLMVNWSGAAHIANATAENTFRFRPPLLVNLGLFLQPATLFAGSSASAWAQNIRLSFDVQNLLNDYRRVQLGNGRVPEGYNHHVIDPLGRTVRFSVQNRF